MKEIIYPRLSGDSMETHYYTTKDSDIVEMDTTYMPDYNKAVKAKWTLKIKYVTADGKIIGGQFEAPKSALSLRTVTKEGKPKKEMTEEQRQEAAKRLAKAREAKSAR